MSSEITINGKTYQARKCTVHTLLKEQKLGEQMQKAVEKDKWDEHTRLFLERAKLFLEGDVSGLSPEILTPAEGLALADFFTVCLAEGLPKPDSMRGTSQDSGASTQAADSPTGTI